MWYKLIQKTNKQETLLEIEKYGSVLYSYFIDNNNPKWMPPEFVALPQKNLTPKLLESLDYLEILSYDVPVFSHSFVEKNSELFKGKMDFYPCKVVSEDKSFTFFLGRVLNILPIIDEEKTGYEQLGNDCKIISEPLIIKSEIDESLLIVRDMNVPSELVVSDLFKQLAEKQKLKIGFYNTAQTFF